MKRAIPASRGRKPLSWRRTWKINLRLAPQSREIVPPPARPRGGTSIASWPRLIFRCSRHDLRATVARSQRRRVQVRATDREIRRTRSVARSRSTAPSRENDAPAKWPRAMRARRLAPSARASLRAASVRFTPSRSCSLSPRRAPLLGRRFPVRTPAPAGPLPHRSARPHARTDARAHVAMATSLRRRR